MSQLAPLTGWGEIHASNTSEQLKTSQRQWPPLILIFGSLSIQTLCCQIFHDATYSVTWPHCDPQFKELWSRIHKNLKRRVVLKRLVGFVFLYIYKKIKKQISPSSWSEEGLTHALGLATDLHVVGWTQKRVPYALVSGVLSGWGCVMQPFLSTSTFCCRHRSSETRRLKQAICHWTFWPQRFSLTPDGEEGLDSGFTGWGPRSQWHCWWAQPLRMPMWELHGTPKVDCGEPEGAVRHAASHLLSGMQITSWCWGVRDKTFTQI